ncbi:MAG TPA: SGNH/GDSL hydrolase family protein [Planctomycetota bacterium]|nr:SGNH/GDSL hydrolase family protein [Planctomycetota bacterium]
MVSPASTPTIATPKPSRWRKIRIALLVLAVGVICALLAGEILLRIAVFHPSPMLGRLGWRLGQPRMYTNCDNDDDYWKLFCKQQGQAALDGTPNPDLITGWTGSDITPGTYEHIDEASLRGRRPVLLYGDSFAQGVTQVKDSFQALFERSELADRYAMLNYGVGGYGLDQIYLLLENSIDRFKDRDPIVIVAILVESDLERSVLEFRCCPKPRLDVVGDRLVARGPVQTNMRKYLEENPISIRSYLWQLFLHSRLDFLVDQRAAWRKDPQIKAEKQVLNRKILLEIERSLSSRKLQHFFFLFHVEPCAVKSDGLYQWQEDLIHEVCAESSIPMVDTRPFLSLAADAVQKKCEQFYIKAGPVQSHHNAIGNLICFEAMIQGLRGNIAQPDLAPLADLKTRGLLQKNGPETVATTLMGRSATLITYGAEGRSFAAETVKPRRFLLRSDALGSTKARIDLSGSAKRFSGRLHTMMNPNEGCAGTELRLTIRIDGEIALERAVPRAANELALDLDLAGKQSLEFTVAGNRGGGNCNWICIEDPQLE